MQRGWLVGILSTVACSGCLLPARVSLPDKNTFVRDQLVFYSDFQLPRHHRLVEDLVALRREVAAKLQLPVSDEPIHVYLFDRPSRYRRFTSRHYDRFAERPAFFVQDDTRLAVFAHWSDRVAEDLRHEVTHGYLHATIPNLPLWLDEGLAEYFEVARGQQGINRAHVDMLWNGYRRDRWTPNLHRLEQLASAEDMTQQDYAEAWLWVHWLLESSPERLQWLQENLHQLQSTGSAPPLSKLLEQRELSMERAVIQHLKSLVGSA